MKLRPSVLSGAVKIPSSKSVGHRLLICAAFSNGESELANLSMSKDIKATMAALTGLGASFKPVELPDGGLLWRVSGANLTKSTASEDHLPLTIQCGESGSTLRFLIPISLALRDHLVFEGEGRLVERPLDDFFPIFKQNNLEVAYEGRLPLKIKGQLKAGSYKLAGNVSSQYTTGMLLAAPLLEGETQLEILGEMESKGYIELTLQAMKQFGISVERQAWERFTIRGKQAYQPQQLSVEGDFSQAAFWIVAGLIGSQPLKLKGLNPDSVQGDRGVLAIVEAMGGQVNWLMEQQTEADGPGDKSSEPILLVEPSHTIGTVIDASQCPDLIPVLCVLAALSKGETRVIRGQRLRVKESDRILSTVTELAKLGADIAETPDGMIIQGKQMLNGGCTVDGWNDHRIVMAMAVASTRCLKEIEITGHEAIQKSYPTFFEDFLSLGGKIES